MSTTIWIAFVLAYSLMALAPGPTILLVVSYAIAYGRRTALAVVAGTSVGDATCLTAALFGVGAILKASATAFALLKLAGAAYLIFLGLRLWHARPVLPGQVPPAPRSLSRVFLHAWLTTVFNPKSILFFMVFVPQFIDARAPLPPQFATMLATVLICGAVIDGTYSTFAVNVRRLVRTPRLQRAVNRTSGGLLVGEGIIAAFWRSLAV